VCDQWRADFSAFLRDMGPRPQGTSLDRIDNSRGYEPGNVRWAKSRQQANNQRANRVLVLNGETHTVAEWERLRGFKPGTIKTRLLRGWTPEKAVAVPVA